jgi:uncharacterized protein (TIGR00255 family)
MTGQGEAVLQAGDLAVRAELRATNNRYFKLSLKLSEGYAALEPRLERLIREHVRRGSVHLSLKIDIPENRANLQINQTALTSIYRQLTALPGAEQLELHDLLPALLSLPGVVESHGHDATDVEQHWSTIETAVKKALGKMCEMRSEEGQAMAVDLTDNLDRIAALVKDVQARAPAVANTYQQRLLDRLNKLLTEHALTVEPADVVREVGLFVDRSDISEETVRLSSHLELFSAEIKSPDAQGRKLDFLTQEMFREANTIGSKANDSHISAQVIDIKTSIERMREMIQNVE